MKTGLARTEEDKGRAGGAAHSTGCPAPGIKAILLSTTAETCPSALCSVHIQTEPSLASVGRDSREGAVKDPLMSQDTDPKHQCMFAILIPPPVTQPAVNILLLCY